MAFYLKTKWVILNQMKETFVLCGLRTISLRYKLTVTAIISKLFSPVPSGGSDADWGHVVRRYPIKVRYSPKLLQNQDPFIFSVKRAILAEYVCIHGVREIEFHIPLPEIFTAKCF